MKPKKQREQTNGTASELSCGPSGRVPSDKEKALKPDRRTRSPQSEGAADALIPPPEKETDKRVIAPDGEPEVKKEPEPLF